MGNSKKHSELKLLFVNPCIRRNSHTKIVPIGLGYVVTFAHSQGFTNFDILDIDLHEYEDSYVEEYIQKNNYDVILLGSIVTHYKWIKWFVHMAKKHQPAAKIIVGNSVAGSIYELFLKKTPADVVIIGEGEHSTAATLEAIRTEGDLSQVEGIAFRDSQGNIHKNPKRVACDVNSLPMVNWDFFDIHGYIAKSHNAMSWGMDGEASQKTIALPIATARGCAFRCTFCHFVFWDDPYRYRSPESVLKEIERNITKYGANYFNFWDDLSFASLPQVEKMCDAILASGLKFKWSAAIRADLFGRDRLPFERRLEVAKKMKTAGCMTTGFSLESGDPEILKMMNKKIEPQFFEDTVNILRNVGIVANTSVVFGYPIETKETIQRTFDQCLKVKVYPSIGYLMPLPYTGMYEYAKQHGFITDEDSYLDSITERQDFTLNMTKLSTEELLEEIKQGAKRLNELLELGLSDDRLVKTGGYRRHTNLKNALDPEKLKRNENDFSFNYSQTVFNIDTGEGSGESC